MNRALSEGRDPGVSKDGIPLVLGETRVLTSPIGRSPAERASGLSGHQSIQVTIPGAWDLGRAGRGKVAPIFLSLVSVMVSWSSHGEKPNEPYTQGSGFHFPCRGISVSNEALVVFGALLGRCPPLFLAGDNVVISLSQQIVQ